jgi:TrpR-related protein YerC/YecD
MSKVNPKSLDKKMKMKYMDLLWTSIANLETRDEVKTFFKDLLSESEAIMLARRIEIARYLLEGWSYDKITQELNVGKDTIVRVQVWLSSGFGGYEKAIEGFEKEMKNRTDRYHGSFEPYSFEWIRRKYPLHFLLFNLLSTKNKNKKSK